MIIRLTDAFRVPFPPLVGEGDALFPMLSILHILFVSISYIQPANSSKLSAIIDFPAAFRCCLSSEDTHTTMQAVYARYFPWVKANRTFWAFQDIRVVLYYLIML